MSEINIYELLDEVRKRPPLYLGNLYSLNSLLAFIQGLSFRDWCGNNPPFDRFGSWLGVRVSEMKRTALPFEWMEREWGKEKSFQMFFELLDEYRACKILCRYRAIITDQKPGFFVGSGIDERIEPKKPLEICVVQFAPSEVYYLLEVYFDRHEDCRPSYRKSAAEVRELAEQHWGVSKDEWLEVNERGNERAS